MNRRRALRGLALGTLTAAWLVYTTTALAAGPPVNGGGVVQTAQAATS